MNSNPEWSQVSLPAADSQTFKTTAKISEQAARRRFTLWTPVGQKLSIQVKLCRRPRESKITYSAAPLVAKISSDDWEGELQPLLIAPMRVDLRILCFTQRSLMQLWCLLKH